MRVFAYFLFYFIILVDITSSINVINQQGHLTLQKIKKDPLIQISMSQSLDKLSQENSQYKNVQFFVLKSLQRHKNKAYLKLLKNYQKLVNILIQKLILGDEKLLVKSKIKQKYLKKKRVWQFGVMFMMQGQTGQLTDCLNDIYRLGVSKISRPVDSSINEQFIASNTFYKLKRKVIQELSRMPGIQILKVQSLDLKGLSFPNTIKLQKKIIQKNLQKLKNQNNEFNEDVSFPTDYFFLKPQILSEQRRLTLTVVFRVGEEVQSYSSSQFQSSSSQFQDDSDNEQEDILEEF